MLGGGRGDLKERCHEESCQAPALSSTLPFPHRTAVVWLMLSALQSAPAVTRRPQERARALAASVLPQGEDHKQECVCGKKEEGRMAGAAAAAARAWAYVFPCLDALQRMAPRGCPLVGQSLCCSKSVVSVCVCVCVRA